MSFHHVQPRRPLKRVAESVAGRRNRLGKQQQDGTEGGQRNSGCRNRSQPAETQSTESVRERELVTCSDGRV